jgi:hypothetical protein
MEGQQQCTLSLAGGLGFYAQWPPPESTRSQPAGGQGGAPPGFRYPEGESPGLGRREAPVKDEDQEFLDELLGITPGERHDHFAVFVVLPVAASQTLGIGAAASI